MKTLAVCKECAVFSFYKLILASFISFKIKVIRAQRLRP